MVINFPIQMNKVSPEILKNTAWCSWYQFGRIGPGVEVLIINEMKMTMATYYGYDDDRGWNNSWGRKAREANGYEVKSYDDGIIRGVGDKKPLGLPTLLFSITDNFGNKFLARGNSYYPDNSNFRFKDLFFPCTDQRPLIISPYFKEYLPKIIKLQTEALISEG